ncbi:MAG: hypothetical protein M0Q01_11460 [Syntrophales bacterium]|jgi:hypothetical protein|nr:hypothetical protein [Syntrophales bacterium]
MIPDLEKIRRFALGTGLILIAYVAAGVDLEAGAKVSMLGIPFIIQRPELLPAGLILASVYGLFRFYYYGFMLGTSPHRHRKNVLHKLHAEVPGSQGTYKGSIFLGPEVYSTTPSTSERPDAETQVHGIINTFPKIGSVIPTGKVKGYHITDEDGDDHISYEAQVTIPSACRIAALLQDLDYAAPIWLNAAALVLAAARV